MILAVDPGKTTGWATYEAGEYQYGQASPFVFLSDVDSWALDTLDVFVVERYTITPQTLKMSRQPDALKIIGVLEWWAVSRDILFVEQTPAEAKSFVTNERLRKLGLYPSGLDHAADAMRHLILYLVKEQVIPASELV